MPARVWLYVVRQAVAAEGWPSDRLHIAWDVATSANDDGTHALRSVFHARELGIPHRSAERQRGWLVTAGWLHKVARGGNGRSANVYELATPAPWAHVVVEARAHLEAVAGERSVVRA